MDMVEIQGEEDKCTRITAPALEEIDMDADHCNKQQSFYNKDVYKDVKYRRVWKQKKLKLTKL